MAISASARLYVWRRSQFLIPLILATLTGLLLSLNLASAQEAAEDEEEALELQDVRVTGSRLSRSPSEISGNLIVLDRDDIRASGELTLARVLRQLPQNTNPTHEDFFSEFNTAGNRTGAASVNLRGLGSESTLILVDGRRVGYSGILGGVTDISTIPLSMVDRIEILLDGASAVYGSDAVGGVVNIITRQDYSGLELDLEYGRPHKSGYDETRASLAAGIAWSGGRANLSYEYFRDTGLDASQRDAIISPLRTDLNPSAPTVKNTAPGPQFRVYAHRTNDACPPPPNRANPLAQLPVLWVLADGSKVTHAEYLALDPGSKSSATCHADVTLPRGFQYTDDINSIDLFGEQNWREEADVGYSLRPEQSYNVVQLGVDQQISDAFALHANVRRVRKDSNSMNGMNALSPATLHANNPFNPFGVQVSLVGFLLDQPAKSFESERDEMFATLGASGSLGSWTWQAEYSSSRKEEDTVWHNRTDPAFLSGLASDGVTGARIGIAIRVTEAQCEARMTELGGWNYTYVPNRFFIGVCTIFGQPPEPTNPFGDTSQYIRPNEYAGSKNEQTQFEALARGNLFNAPGGPVALVVGYDFREDVLDSFKEFLAGDFLDFGTPTGTSNFNTRISRDNSSGFVEGLIPLIGSNNAMAGVRRLNLTFSGRYDSYSDVQVEYRQGESGQSTSVDAADPGSEFTWSAGLVYEPGTSVRFRGNFSTSFVAPQLNQLLSQTRRLPTGLFVYLIDEDPGFAVQTGNVIRYQGGNDGLVPETADNINLTGEFTPPFLPGLFLKVGWSDTDFTNRIVKLRVPVVEDLNQLPPNITYLPDDDIYVIDDRWINSYAVNRSGMDYELRYEWERGAHEFGILLRRSYTNSFDVQQTPISKVVHDLVGQRDDTGEEDTSLLPIPRHQTNMQFTWANGGVFMSLNVKGADDTTILRLTNEHRITEPATIYDLVLSYDFGQDTLFDAPAWMEGLITTLTINNITNTFSKTTALDPNTGTTWTARANLNSAYEWTQGRSYRLNIHKSF